MYMFVVVVGFVDGYIMVFIFNFTLEIVKGPSWWVDMW